MRRLLPIAVVGLAAVVVPGPSMALKPRPGSMDRSFGTNGRLAFNLPGERMQPGAIAVDSANRILVAGQLADSATDFPGDRFGRAFVARLRPDGTLDPTFADGGVTRVRLPEQVWIRGVAVQPDGSLFLTGTAILDPGDELGAVVKLLPTGAADQTFGSEGLATVPGENLTSYSPVRGLSALAVQPDGRIVVAGQQRAYDVHTAYDPLVARLLPNGGLDPGFDGNGVARIGPGNPTVALTRPDGSAVVLGWDEYYFGNSALVALRVAPGDKAFPIPESDAPAAYEFRRSVNAAGASLRPDGSILLVGGLQAGTRHFMTWVRIGPSLELLDRGRVESDRADLAAFDSHGAVITATATPTLGTSPIAMHRYRGRTLRADPSYGRRDGTTPIRIDNPAALIGLATQRDKVLVAATNGFQIGKDVPVTLYRLHAHLDTTAPVITVRGLPRAGCIGGLPSPLIRTRDDSRIRVTVRLDGHLIRTSRANRIRIRLTGDDLPPGPHRLVVRARDEAGYRSRAGAPFRICT